MDRLLDPKNDWAFKQVFGQEKNKKILISFLNAIFRDVEEEIEDVSFLKVETDTEIITLRQSIVDVLCKTIDGRQFIVEMQRASDTGFIQRAVEYASRVYLNQRNINKKEKNDKGSYKQMRPVIFLAIMEKTLFPKKEEYLSHHQFRDIVTGERDIKEMSFSFLELSKFHKHFNELKDDIDKWAYFLKKAKHIKAERLEEILKGGTIFGEAYRVLERATYTPEQLLEYTRYELKEEEIETRISDAKNIGRAEGEKIGRAEGEKIGRAEGEKIGIKKEKLEIARNLIVMGLQDDQIMQATGITAEEIKKLRP